MRRAPVDLDRLRDELGARWPRIDVVARTASTNADLLARPDAADRTALIAEHQSAGRGRFDRVWSSPPRAGLTLSVVLRPDVPVARWGWLPLLTGLALAQAVTEVTGVPAALKWPNDLLVDGRKAAGILAQTSGTDDGAVVVGLGLNVSTTADELPVPTATSLTLAGAPEPDRTALAVAVLTRLDARVAQWSDVRGDAAACALDAAYRKHCATLGQRVRVTAADGSGCEAVALDVDENGHLVLDVDGTHAVVAAGDVEHVRPADARSGTG